MKPGTDEHALRKLFSKFGEITGVNHRGNYAFVEFVEPESAATAIAEMAKQGDMRVQKAYASRS